MTTTQTPHQPDTDRRNKLLIAGGIAVVALAVLAFVVYWFVFRDDSAAGVDTQEAADALERAGITSILNFTAHPVVVPDHVVVRRVDLATELQILSFYQQRGVGTSTGAGLPLESR